MPSDGIKFGFTVLVGEKELSEYIHPEDSTRVLIETTLWSPVTYYEEIKEFSQYSGEVECQKWPVTPYKIEVKTKPGCELSYYRVYVDGVVVKNFLMYGGKSKVIEGFPCADGYREFLFSLPRFAESEKDRVDSERSERVGKIEVVRYAAVFSHFETHPKGVSSHTEKEPKFKQANKKDVEKVTKNDYCMTTTRKGKLLREEKPYDRPKKKTDSSPLEMESVRMFKMGEELGRLQVEYHMTQTLLDWGIQPIPLDWPVRDLGTIELSDHEEG